MILRYFKILLIALFLLAAVCSISIILINRYIEKSAEGIMYDRTTLKDLPYNNIGVLLGTSPWVKSGKENLYYKYRIDAAVELIKSGKIKCLIVSGDNRKANYNEPKIMRRDLIKRGVPESVIICDYGGTRTFDSMLRAKHVFGQTRFTVISQQFHNERAAYICKNNGMDVVCYNAMCVERQEIKTREYLARVKAFIDIVIKKKCNFSEPIILPCNCI